MGCTINGATHWPNQEEINTLWIWNQGMKQQSISFTLQFFALKRQATNWLVV